MLLLKQNIQFYLIKCDIESKYVSIRLYVNLPRVPVHSEVNNTLTDAAKNGFGSETIQLIPFKNKL